MLLRWWCTFEHVFMLVWSLMMSYDLNFDVVVCLSFFPHENFRTLFEKSLVHVCADDKSKIGRCYRWGLADSPSGYGSTKEWTATHDGFWHCCDSSLHMLQLHISKLEQQQFQVPCSQHNLPIVKQQASMHSRIWLSGRSISSNSNNFSTSSRDFGQIRN